MAPGATTAYRTGMFVGHLALAYAAKRARPSANVAWYVAAVTTADLLWPIFLLLGVEHVSIAPGATAFNPLVFNSYPWSHSLLMLIVWGFVLARIARTAGVDDQAARLLVPLVVSHWVLDFITHAPDMPLWPAPGSPELGLGLWNSIPGTFAVEGAMWVAGLALYLRGRHARSWGARIAFWSFVVVTTAMWATGPFGPPPPSARALAWFGLIGWITIPWSAFADRGYVVGKESPDAGAQTGVHPDTAAPET